MALRPSLGKPAVGDVGQLRVPQNTAEFKREIADAANLSFGHRVIPRSASSMASRNCETLAAVNTSGGRIFSVWACGPVQLISTRRSRNAFTSQAACFASGAPAASTMSGPHEQPGAAHRTDRIELTGERLHALAQLRADLRRVRLQPLLLDDVQHGAGRGAGDRVAGIGVEVAGAAAETPR